MTWDIVAGLCTLMTALLPILSVVLKLNRSLVALEEAVKQLRAYIEKQSERNHGFSDRLLDHERRLVRLESERTGGDEYRVQKKKERRKPMMQNWKNKLASRKFWSAVVGVVVALCAAFGADEMTVQQITAVITAVGVLVAYIFAESYVDANRTDEQEKE